MDQEKKVKISTLAYAVALLILGFLVAVGVLIYGFGMDNQVTQKVAHVFPYPAVIINGVNFIALDQVADNLKAVRHFYENQDFGSVGLKVDFATPDGQKRLKIKEKELLTKMIENRIIGMLANKNGIVLTKDAISQEVSKRMAQYGNNGDLAGNLQKLYGWSISDFEEKIVAPDMYKAALADKVRNSDPATVKAKAKIDQAAADLATKKDFAAVAEQYSDGDSAKNGGELGWFSADQMLPEIAVAVFNMKVGDASDVIQSSLGYHIVQLEDKKTENGVDKVRLRQVFVRTQSFADWLLGQEKNIKIYVPLKDYYWNAGEGMVEFHNNDLKQFEQNLNQNSPDDASMLF
jgi:hypothetical protein